MHMNICLLYTSDVYKRQAEGGFKSSADDKIFNNYVVAPVKTKFDFTKKLAGRELKDGEFKFVLKDANGQEVETVTNKADGTVTFTELSFDNSKVGTHTYTVEEVVPAAKEAGMVYDTCLLYTSPTGKNDGSYRDSRNYFFW